MRRLSELFQDKAGMIRDEDSFVVRGYRGPATGKLRINILAMGDVGGTLALGLKLTGKDIVERIGICDLDEAVCARYEAELNQISLPDDYAHFPPVKVVPSALLFDCDVLLFCAAKGVPPVQEKRGDMRMAQLEGNLQLIAGFGKQAVKERFRGEFFVVSDPVDPLCKQVFKSGLDKGQIKGFGLGVMNARAAYFAKQREDLVEYLAYGRAFGPHGQDLVICNNIQSYDPERSRCLTDMTVQANLEVRRLGFKPYIAPAMSSGVLSVLADLRGEWHYSSAYFGKGADRAEKGAFLGMRCRRVREGLMIEDRPLDDRLFQRICQAVENLEALI